MLMARARIMTIVRSEIVLSIIINILARRVSGRASVGLKAVAVLYPRYSRGTTAATRPSGGFIGSAASSRKNLRARSLWLVIRCAVLVQASREARCRAANQQV